MRGDTGGLRAALGVSIQAHDGVLTQTAPQFRQALESTSAVDHPHELAQHEDEIFCSGIAECRRTTCQEG